LVASSRTLKLHFHNLRTSKRFGDGQGGDVPKTDELLEEAYQKVRSMAHTKNAGVYAQSGLIPAVKKICIAGVGDKQVVIQVQEHGMADRLENSLEIYYFQDDPGVDYKHHKAFSGY
jgi:hypothetical protein